MADWSIRIDAEYTGRSITEDQIAALMDWFQPHSGAVSIGAKTVGASFYVTASGPLPALDRGLRIFKAGLKAVGLRRVQILGAESQLWEDFVRSLERPTIPELVGVAEVARILKVSRQRASELARSAGFPHPVATLAAGPVWLRSSISRHIVRWPRRPGRPRKVPSAV